MNRNIAVIISYDGSAYHGWQIQSNAVSVQETLRRAASSLFNEDVITIGCGRTDAGVHALKYTALLKTSSRIPTSNIPRGLNALLPNDISVMSAYEVPADFHPTYSCIEKEYTYYIYTSKARNPFLQNRALHHPYGFDLNSAKKAASLFEGTHDFSAMRNIGTETASTVRTVYACEIQASPLSASCGELISIRISASGFLYNMARTIVGTLIDVASGKIPCGDIEAILASGARDNAGATAPPYALYMTNVIYPERFGLPKKRIGGITNVP